MLGKWTLSSSLDSGEHPDLVQQLLPGGALLCGVCAGCRGSCSRPGGPCDLPWHFVTHLHSQEAELRRQASVKIFR